MIGSEEPNTINSQGKASARLAGANVLVTGGTGFIGSLLVNRLSSLGCRISMLVENQCDVGLTDCHVHRGNLLARDTLLDAGKDAGLVYHLAAFTDPDAESPEDVERCFSVNVEGTKNLLSSLGPSTEHVIFFSTVYVFGRQNGEGIDEAFPINPSTPYGRSKLEAENLVREWGLRNGVMTTCLRLPVVYGPGNKGNIYRMIDAIAKRRFLLIGRGANKRSMIYVGNVVDAAIAVAFREEADGAVFIVTDSEDYSVLELYRTILELLGIRPLPLRVPLPIARVAATAFNLAGRMVGKELPYNSRVLSRLTSSLTFSSKQIEDTVGFRPACDLREGMAKTVRWYREQV